MCRSARRWLGWKSTLKFHRLRPCAWSMVEMPAAAQSVVGLLR